MCATASVRRRAWHGRGERLPDSLYAAPVSPDDRYAASVGALRVGCRDRVRRPGARSAGVSLGNLRMKTRRVQIVSVDGQDLRIIVPLSAEPWELVIRQAGSRSAANGERQATSPSAGAFARAEGPLDDFLKECCQPAGDAWVRSADLSICYAWWCKRERRPRLGWAAFLYRVKALGFEPSRSRRDGLTQLRSIEGLRIRPEILNLMLEEQDAGGLAA